MLRTVVSALPTEAHTASFINKSCRKTLAEKLRVEKFTCILWNLKVYCRVYNIPPHLPVWIQITAVHIPPSYSFKIHFDIFYHIRLFFSKWLLLLRFPYQDPLDTFFLFHSYPTHIFLRDIITEKYFVRIQIFEFFFYKILSTPLLFCPRSAQMSSSAPHSRTPSAHFFTAICDTKFHTHIKQQAKNNICIYFNVHILS